MRRVRAYSREERKRLIIHVLAEAVRKDRQRKMSTAEIAHEMDITVQTKLRTILKEMVADELLKMDMQEDAGIAGFRLVFYLNDQKEGFAEQNPNNKASRKDRIIRLNIGGKVEALTL